MNLVRYKVWSTFDTLHWEICFTVKISDDTLLYFRLRGFFPHSRYSHLHLSKQSNWHLLTLQHVKCFQSSRNPMVFLFSTIFIAKVQCLSSLQHSQTFIWTILHFSSQQWMQCSACNTTLYTFPQAKSHKKFNVEWLVVVVLLRINRLYWWSYTVGM